MKRKRVHIVGFGRSGRAAALLAVSKGFEVTATDLKKPEQIDGISEIVRKGVRLNLGSHDWNFFENADLIVVSPGVRNSQQIKRAEKMGIEVIPEIEFGYRYLKSKIIAVTGTNGKSTVTSMIGSIMSETEHPVWTGGNLGPPLCGGVESKANCSDGWFVIELSSFQLERIREFRPHIALILNIAPDHLDRYVSFDEYAIAKCRIFANQLEDDHLIIFDESELIKRCDDANSKVHLVGFDRGEVRVEGSYVLVSIDGYREFDVDVSECGVKEPVNVLNSAFAICASFLAGARRDEMVRGLRKFKPLDHRFRIVLERGGVRWINDSKATNPSSMIGAIDSARDSVILIAGGMGKGVDFSVIRDRVLKKVRVAILFGSCAEEIANAVDGACEIYTTGSVEGAVQIAGSVVKEGEDVVFSPGCASFDMFENFEHRGRVFVEAVRRLYD